MGDEYTEEKLRNALDALATSAASIQQRLRSAALAIVALEPTDFDDPRYRASFRGLVDVLNAREAVGDEGTLEATISRMSDEQAVAASETIVQLYFAMTLRR